jgi:hypothetical protein
MPLIEKSDGFPAGLLPLPPVGLEPATAWERQGIPWPGAELAEEIPAGATFRVTAKVQIFGRFNGNGKADGWFQDRLWQEI